MCGRASVKFAFTLNIHSTATSLTVIRCASLLIFERKETRKKREARIIARTPLRVKQQSRNNLSFLFHRTRHLPAAAKAVYECGRIVKAHLNVVATSRTAPLFAHPRLPRGLG